jgi:hypothetical protein
MLYKAFGMPLCPLKRICPLFDCTNFRFSQIFSTRKKAQKKRPRRMPKPLLFAVVLLCLAAQIT